MISPIFDVLDGCGLTGEATLQPVSWDGWDVLKGLLVVLGLSAAVVLPVAYGAWADIFVVRYSLLTVLEGTFLLVAWWYAVRKYRSTWSSLGVKLLPGPPPFLLAGSIAVLGVALSVLYQMLLSVMGLSEPVTTSVLAEGATQRWALFPLLVIWGPFCEEVFFRGFSYPGLARGTSKWKAAALSSLVFGVAHGHPVLIFQSFVLGMLLVWLYQRTGSLWAPFMAHAFYNSIGLALVG